jgi:glycosyltransferase involved in cell wall biosynthesis
LAILPRAVPLRVLQVVPYFHPAWAYGGIPRLAWGLSRALRERGHEVSVVTTDALDAASRLPAGPVDVGGIPVVRLRNLSNSLAYYHQLFLPLGAGPALAGALSSADVVHLHGWWHALNNVAVAAARRAQVPVVATPNGTLLALERKIGIKSAWDAVLGRPVFDAVSRWIAVSRAELAQFAQRGVPRERSHLVHNGLDLGEFERLPARGSFRAARGLGQRPLLLYLGKLTPRKGVQHLIAALPHLRAGDPVLVIAGNDMGVGDALQQQARELGLSDRALFVGLLQGEERLAALADADVLVYPSSDEIFGLVPFEGLLCGTPAVVSDDCGCGELVAEARAGELVRFGDSEGLARAMDGLLQDGRRRAGMVARGRRFIEQQFAWPKIAAQTEAVYEAAIRSPRDIPPSRL